MMMVLSVGIRKYRKRISFLKNRGSKFILRFLTWFQALSPHQIRALPVVVSLVMQIHKLSFSTPAHFPSYLIFSNDTTTFKTLLSFNLSKYSLSLTSSLLHLVQISQLNFRGPPKCPNWSHFISLFSIPCLPLQSRWLISPTQTRFVLRYQFLQLKALHPSKTQVHQNLTHILSNFLESQYHHGQCLIVL